MYSLGIKAYVYMAIITSIILVGTYYIYSYNSMETTIKEQEVEISNTKLESKIKVFEQYVEDTNLTTKGDTNETIKHDISIGKHTITI